MKIYIFAGPNGSGKSTIIKDYIKSYNLENIEYICPDVYASNYFSHIEDIKQRYITAMNFAEYKREKLLKNKQSFIMETVLSRKDKLGFLKTAKEQGYEIVGVFVCTASADINVQRVKKRALEGGHDVPKEKIIERYNRSVKNLQAFSQICNELYIYDNTLFPKLVYALVDDVKFEAKDIPLWAVIE
ncbi:MAG: zeta toxin family protein [Acutalibacteraceae bacterium]